MRMPYQVVSKDEMVIGLAENIIEVLIKSGVSFQTAFSALSVAQERLYQKHGKLSVGLLGDPVHNGSPK